MKSALRAVRDVHPADVRASAGMAATSQPLASLAAAEILNLGGTAVDAAIAANAMLGLTEPTGCGIGGDLFALVWDPGEKKLFGLNASGRSPRGLTLQDLRTAVGGEAFIPVRGPLSVSVPGCVSGWFELHTRFGRLPMTNILAPAIQTARRGFPVTRFIAEEWSHDLNALSRLDPDRRFTENLHATFAPSGTPPSLSDTFKNPDLADTLEAVSLGGPQAFYEGNLARIIERYVERVGGYLRADDLAAHFSEWVEPLSTRYRGFDVFELPPNSQGITALQMFAILGGMDADSMESARWIHNMVEAKKLAFEDRARLYADPAFTNVSLEKLLSKSRAAEQRSRIRDESVLSCEVAWLRMDEYGDTCYLTTADSSGMMVSLIQSNFRKFGSGLVPDGLGFGLQNRGSLFSLNPTDANVFEPAKRPFQTIMPAFVFEEGHPVLSFGVMGGAMQPQGHVQILSHLIDRKLGLQEAGDEPRWRHVGSSRPTGFRGSGNGVVLVENTMSQTIQEGLSSRGHDVQIKTRHLGTIFGGYQGIAVDRARNEFVGASDRRKDGMALGV